MIILLSSCKAKGGLVIASPSHHSAPISHGDDHMPPAHAHGRRARAAAH